YGSRLSRRISAIADRVGQSVCTRRINVDAAADLNRAGQIASTGVARGRARIGEACMAFDRDWIRTVERKRWRRGIHHIYGSRLSCRVAAIADRVGQGI